MKTAEDILKEKGITKNTKYHNYDYLYKTFVDIINKIQTENGIQMLELRSQLNVEKSMKY